MEKKYEDQFTPQEQQQIKYAERIQNRYYRWFAVTMFAPILFILSVITGFVAMFMKVHWISSGAFICTALSVGLYMLGSIKYEKWRTEYFNSPDPRFKI